MEKERLDMVSVADFGAVGDGVTDDTAAFEQAMQAAAETGNAVEVPAGVYAVGEMRVPPHITLQGYAGWSRDAQGGSVLKLRDEEAVCLLDLTDAKGAVICGLTLLGDNLGECVHGIFAEYAACGALSDYYRIEDCKCQHFSGDGVHLVNVNKAAIHHCLFADNRCGAVYDGRGLQFVDNRCCGNRECGFYAGEILLSGLCGTLFDENGTDGVRVDAARGLQLHSNVFEKNGAAGVALCASADKMSEGVTVTGSNFRDNGLKAAPAESCHFSACFIDGLVLMGNTCGASDPANVPECGFVIHHVENGTVSSNVLRGCARHTMRLDALRESACAENNLV